MPYGNSWQAQFIKDANANYIYENTKGSGSIALSFESVLDKSKDAEYWVAPGQFQSFQQLLETSSHYAQFKAVQNTKVYTYSNSLGANGGVLYYELAPARPDLVLKDLISIFHPELMPEYQPTFFKVLQ
ncbi:ABC transporter substrate-binding protein [Gillisia marina]|uniref:ABC transporter substrate-binding protein n=1 Tax=Gillisia marina TaxID=1167637 RepID=UPI0029343B9B|nr:ABC transporter substrate-binding protein [Gillisia marina]